MTKQKYAVSDINDSANVEVRFEENDYSKLCNGASKGLLPTSVDSFALFGRPSVLKSKWWYRKRRQTFSLIGNLVCLFIYICYMIYAISYDFDNIGLLLFDCTVVLIWVAAHAERSRKLFASAGRKLVKAKIKINDKVPFLRM